MDVTTAERRVWDEVGVRPVEHRLELARLGSTVRVQEVGAGPPAVFLHGASVGGTSWADLVAALPDVRCILVDRPGCGGSDPPPDGNLEGLLAVADDLVADILDALDVTSAAVVATSRGGMGALRGAAAHPDRVARLVLLGWCLGVPGGTPAPWWIRAGALPGAARVMPAAPMSRRGLEVALRRFGMGRAIDSGAMSDAALDWLVALYRDTETLGFEAATAAELLTLRDGWRDVVPADRLAAIRAPALLVWGDEDPFGDVGDARLLADALPDADVHLLDRAGHAPWLDRPATCTDLVRNFLLAPSTGA